MAAGSDYFSGGGRLYFEERNSDGSTGALLYFGRTSGITLSAAITYKEAYNSEDATQLLGKRLPAKTDVTATFTTDQVDVDSLALAFNGTKIDMTQAAGTDVAKVVTVIEVPSFIDLEVYNMTTIVVKDSGDITTYVEDVDYIMHNNSGFLEIVEGGAIIAGDLNLTMTYPEYVYTGVAGFKKATTEGRFIVVTDTDTNNNYKVIIKRMSVVMEGDFALKNPDEFTTIPFTGTAVIDTDTVSGTWSDYLDYIPIDAEA